MASESQIEELMPLKVGKVRDKAEAGTLQF
jgi:hypothetical protein